MSHTAPHVCMTLRLPDRTGAAKMALGFARALLDEGFAITLIHGDPPAAAPSSLPDFASLGVHLIHEPLLERPWDPRLAPALAQRVIARRGRCVIGVNQTDRAPAMLAATRAGVPGVLMVGNQHHFWGPRPLAALKRRRYGAILARHTDLAVCTSTVVRDEVRTFGVPDTNTVVLPNGIEIAEPVELDRDRRTRLRADMGARDDRLLLLNVGRLNPQKGQDLLLEALGRPTLLPVQIALVGAAPEAGSNRHTRRYEADLRVLLEDLDLVDSVRFMGWRDDVESLLAAADGYVHAARWEGPALPLSVMEAMAAGRPTVFTDCSGEPPGFEQTRHGLIARTGQPGDIRARITDLIDMADADRVAMGTDGAALIRGRYRLEQAGRSFTRLVRDVLERDALGRA